MLSIDPGVNYCGVAIFKDLRLTGAYIVRNGGKSWLTMAHNIPKDCEVIIELPQVYRVGLSKGDPNDLIQLAAVVGCIVGVLGVPYTLVKPRDWKGQVPKTIHHERIKAKLTPQELACVNVKPASLAHNVWDAIGIGLWKLKR